MRSLVLMSLLFTLISCGSESHLVFVDRVETQYTTQDFEGVYYFEYGGRMEIIAGIDNELTILREDQSLQSINPVNDTIGSHPYIYYMGLKLNNNVARFSTNVNYGVDTYDLEEDASGSDIEGSHRTDYEFKMVDSNLQLTIRIYSGTTNNNLNYVVAKRVLTSI